MAWVTEDFLATWHSGRNLGASKPTQVVQVRRGNWRRDYRLWPGATVHAVIPDEPTFTNNADEDLGGLGFWRPIFTETTDWKEVPNVISVAFTRDLLQANGMKVATVVLDNVGYVEQTVPSGSMMGQLYHLIERGMLAPYRGSVPDYRPDPGWVTNEWEDLLAEQGNLRIWQGFGEPERDIDGVIPLDGGSNGAWVFNGMIDDVDFDSNPVQMTMTARMGKLLTDGRLFGWNMSKQLRDPIIFASSTQKAKLANQPNRWIGVDDVSDVVRVVLRWAGYTEWEVEDTGISLPGSGLAFNRATYLIDVIKKAMEATGFIFFIADPTNGDSNGVPTFRRSAATLREPAGISADVKDTDLITGLQVKTTEAPRAYIIRVRGREDADDGVYLGGDKTRRIMTVYRPPWTLTNMAGGVIKHVVLTNNALKNEVMTQAGCFLVAIAEALEAATAVAEIPANINIELDDQVGLLDTSTSVNSRLWITGIQESMTAAANDKMIWQMTLTGSLIDNHWLDLLLNEILALSWDTAVAPAVLTGTRELRRR